MDKTPTISSQVFILLLFFSANITLNYKIFCPTWKGRGDLVKGIFTQLAKASGIQVIEKGGTPSPQAYMNEN